MHYQNQKHYPSQLGYVSNTSQSPQKGSYLKSKTQVQSNGSFIKQKSINQNQTVSSIFAVATSKNEESRIPLLTNIKTEQGSNLTRQRSLNQRQPSSQEDFSPFENFLLHLLQQDNSYV